MALKVELSLLLDRESRDTVDTFEALGKESFDDGLAALVLQSGGSKHLPEMGLRLLVDPERVFVTRGLR